MYLTSSIWLGLTYSLPAKHFLPIKQFHVCSFYKTKRSYAFFTLFKFPLQVIKTLLHHVYQIVPCLQRIKQNRRCLLVASPAFMRLYKASCFVQSAIIER